MNGAQGDGSADTHQHEIVIIRRRNNGEEAPHKGGVWKIAHADFMTALMAFFLVMWLISATDEKTITGVANYFNPMRLTDSSARPKGIHDIDPHGDQKDNKGKDAPGKHDGAESKATEGKKKAEAALFVEPYVELDKIAAEAGKGQPEAHPTQQGNSLGRHSGEAYRDPFDPDSRYDPAHQGTPEDHAASERENAEAAKEPQAAERPSNAARDEHDVAAAASAELLGPIEQAVKATGLSPIPGIDVRATDEGVLISISDQPDFEMFGIASARPKPELVVLMETIGKVIVARPEHIVIRGHTDGRPYRAGDYDNWRLSTARAQMAYYMLMRSGIPEGRIDRIEGHADHNLQNSDSPLAAENRRIEILLTKGKS